MLAFTLTLLALAHWRATRLITDDFIFAWLRDWLDGHAPYLGYLVSCTYCLGLWFAAPFAYLGYEFLDLTVFQGFLLWPALSATAVFIQKFDEWEPGA